MGRINTTKERADTLVWGSGFHGVERSLHGLPLLSGARDAFIVELESYFALACLSRHHSESKELVDGANRIVYRVRNALEMSLQQSVQKAVGSSSDRVAELFAGSFFGASKKQGTSLRMSLTTCKPTSLCASACYAHDVLDAAPAAVVRGVVNGLVASVYEAGDTEVRQEIRAQLARHVRSAVRSAVKEVGSLEDGFSRRPNIRFAHVGEIACFPGFANFLAKMVYDASAGGVDCVVYTRLAEASQLDPDLWIINFTLDESSMDRQTWVPVGARVVYSAFEGRIWPGASVNFLEHHRWSHTKPVGGECNICAATLPETKVRSCDAVKCDLCFRRIDCLQASETR